MIAAVLSQRVLVELNFSFQPGCSRLLELLVQTMWSRDDGTLRMRGDFSPTLAARLQAVTVLLVQQELADIHKLTKAKSIYSYENVRNLHKRNSVEDILSSLS